MEWLNWDVLGIISLIILGIGLAYVLVRIWKDPFSRGLLGLMMIIVGVIVEAVLTVMVFSPESRPDWLTPIISLITTALCLLSIAIGYVAFRSVDKEDGGMY